MTLTVKKVFGARCRREIKRIYYASFPKEDRMPFFMMSVMTLLPTTKFLAYYDGETPCGFLYYAILGGQIFVMFFAVDETIRGKGYGTQILSALKADNCKKKVIVSIEPSVNESAVDMNHRRKAFYLRNGFCDTGYMIRLGKAQEVLIANGIFSKLEFRLFLALYSLFTLWPKIWKKHES